MRTIDANTLSGSARDTAGSTSSFGDNSATYQRIVKEIRARRNPNYPVQIRCPFRVIRVGLTPRPLLSR